MKFGLLPDNLKRQYDPPYVARDDQIVNVVNRVAADQGPWPYSCLLIDERVAVMPSSLQADGFQGYGRH